MEKEINELRSKLDKKITEKGSLTDSEVYELSIELDELIAEYLKKFSQKDIHN